MDATALTVCGYGKHQKELSYVCFPTKLFRLTSSEKYCSIWWAQDGTHIVIDVPKFEKEILRNDRIPTSDSFKTMTFTSFIRQLNLYGFRKVALDIEQHIDPIDWQRYAHANFFRGGQAYLERVRRQPGPFHCRVAKASKQAIAAMRNYNDAVTHHLMCLGLRPSRKGPRVTRTTSPSNFAFAHAHIPYQRALPGNLAGFPPQNPPSFVPMFHQVALQVPTGSYVTHQTMVPPRPLGGVAEVQLGARNLQSNNQGNLHHLCDGGFIAVHPSDINLTPEQWQILGQAFQNQQFSNAAPIIMGTPQPRNAPQKLYAVQINQPLEAGRSSASQSDCSKVEINQSAHSSDRINQSASSISGVKRFETCSDKTLLETMPDLQSNEAIQLEESFNQALLDAPHATMTSSNNYCVTEGSVDALPSFFGEENVSFLL